jgi:hypothetical protein
MGHRARSPFNEMYVSVNFFDFAEMYDLIYPPLVPYFPKKLVGFYFGAGGGRRQNDAASAFGVDMPGAASTTFLFFYSVVQDTQHWLFLFSGV